MPTKPIDPDLCVFVTDFYVYMSFGINEDACVEDPEPLTPAYTDNIRLELITEVVEPLAQKGYQLKLNVSGSDNLSWLHLSKVEDLAQWARWSKDDSARPEFIGKIGRSRAKVMEGYIRLPPRLVSELHTILRHEKKQYLSVSAEGTRGHRRVSKIYLFPEHLMEEG